MQTHLGTPHGALGSNTAFVGFTAGTGGTVSTQEILTWSYQVT